MRAGNKAGVLTNAAVDPLLAKERDGVRPGGCAPLRMFRNPVVVGGGTPYLPPVTEDVRLELIETRTFGSRVIYERYRRVRDDLD